MVQTSTIRYDYDHPHEMKLVFVEWAEHRDMLTMEAKMLVYDEWIADKVRLAICQKAWNRIVATHL